ncbi:hypothetical protein B0T16DRAFT_322386 [Cercophora newfieldiana]|uniref:Uncharacterized protein n=1 Tax=Cercophora newfieldiana TaxID=92897 RepID=A0AA40CWE1_9PEZI|nr:hypothetical protein B0T16DRAFT_322386 [Cercophora newfieldiana]
MTTPITLRSPSRYASTKSTPAFQPPSLEWLSRTWSVSHSTLKMWRSAQNVRITYKLLEPLKSDPPRERIDDKVEYENLSGKGGVKSVSGVDTAEIAGDGSIWTWRGKGLLALVSSHWELLGWGERTLADGTTERWMVSWFAATMFTKEGLDVLSDRKEGPSEGLADEVLAALKALEARPVAELVAKDMLPVAINLPWKGT